MDSTSSPAQATVLLCLEEQLYSFAMDLPQNKLFSDGIAICC